MRLFQDISRALALRRRRQRLHIRLERFGDASEQSNKLLIPKASTSRDRLGALACVFLRIGTPRFKMFSPGYRTRFSPRRTTPKPIIALNRRPSLAIGHGLTPPLDLDTAAPDRDGPHARRNFGKTHPATLWRDRRIPAQEAIARQPARALARRPARPILFLAKVSRLSAHRDADGRLHGLGGGLWIRTTWTRGRDLLSRARPTIHHHASASATASHHQNQNRHHKRHDPPPPSTAYFVRCAFGFSGRAFETSPFKHLTTHPPKITVTFSTDRHVYALKSSVLWLRT